MATLQKVKQSPVQLAAGALKSKNKSKQCIKEICGIVLSSILYYRKYLPDEYFENNLTLENEPMRILKTNMDHSFAQHIYSVIFSVHEAINLGYLKKLVVVVLNNEEPQEIHSLNFEYSGEDYKTIMLEQSIQGGTRGQVKAAIETLKEDIMKLLLSFVNILKKTSDCYQLDKAAIAFELDYFDNIPQGYCPEHFKRFENSKNKYSLGLRHLHIGRVVTPFHSLNLKSQFKRTINKQLRSLLSDGSQDTIEDSNHKRDDQSNTKEKLVEITGFTETEKNLVKQTKNTQKTNEGGDLVEEVVNTQDIFAEAELNMEDVSTLLVVPNRKKGIRCPCKTTYELEVLLKCHVCNFKQHNFCFDILDYRDCPSVHICNLCAAQNRDIKCTVPELVTMDEDDKVERSLFRLILGLFFTERLPVSVESLVNVLELESEYAVEVMDRLKKMKLLVKNKDGYGFNKLMFERKYYEKFFPISKMYDFTQNSENEESTKKKPRSVYVEASD